MYRMICDFVQVEVFDFATVWCVFLDMVVVEAVVVCTAAVLLGIAAETVAWDSC